MPFQDQEWFSQLPILTVESTATLGSHTHTLLVQPPARDTVKSWHQSHMFNSINPWTRFARMESSEPDSFSMCSTQIDLNPNPTEIIEECVCVQCEDRPAPPPRRRAFSKMSVTPYMCLIEPNIIIYSKKASRLPLKCFTGIDFSLKTLVVENEAELLVITAWVFKIILGGFHIIWLPLRGNRSRTAYRQELIKWMHLLDWQKDSRAGQRVVCLLSAELSTCWLSLSVGCGRPFALN